MKRRPDGTVSASAEVLLLEPPPGVATAWEAERAHWEVDEVGRAAPRPVARPRFPD